MPATARMQLHRLRVYLSRRKPTTPLEVLDVATQARERLDALERAAIAEARAAGATWADIGDVLGISRQTAHEKHATHARGPNI